MPDLGASMDRSAFIFRLCAAPRYLLSSYAIEGTVNPAWDVRRLTAAETKYMRRTAGCTWTDYKTNTQIAKELKITPVLDKLLEYRRNWIQHVNRMPRNRLLRVMKHYSPTGRRNHGIHLKKLLEKRETGTGQQVAQRHDRYLMMMMMMMMKNEMSQYRSCSLWNQTPLNIFEP